MYREAAQRRIISIERLHDFDFVNGSHMKIVSIKSTQSCIVPTVRRKKYRSGSTVLWGSEIRLIGD
jgi:hypothetical protein